jgi:hypothetical protein
MAISVIGPAFGRMGTMSLKSALERLGFGPCYHMFEVYEAGHEGAWTDVINGGVADWPPLFAAYQSVVDWPACTYWKQIWTTYPDARIVLARRDANAWFSSMEQTIFQALWSRSDDESRNRWRVQTRKLIFEQTFGNDLTRAHCIEVLRAHEADVIASVPSNQLLVYEVGAGWAPLCAYFDVPEPDEPFPHSNTTADFRIWTGLDEASG